MYTPMKTYCITATVTEYVKIAGVFYTTVKQVPAFCLEYLPDEETAIKVAERILINTDSKIRTEYNICACAI